MGSIDSHGGPVRAVVVLDESVVDVPAADSYSPNALDLGSV